MPAAGSRPRARPAWSGPEPLASHVLLLAACRLPLPPALAAWERWLSGCSFDDEDVASFELASLAVARLGPAVGDGSEVSRSRGWSRRAWLVSSVAADGVSRLEVASEQLGVQLIGVGDVATAKADLRNDGRPFPIRSLEFHVPGATPAELVTLRTAAMGGLAGDVADGHLPLVLRTDDPRLDPTTVAGHLVWLMTRNWRRSPPGRLRWILEVLASIELADSDGEADRLPDHVAEVARERGTTAAVSQALGHIAASGLDGPGDAGAGRLDEPVAAIRAAVAAGRRPILSVLRLWHAQHPRGRELWWR